MRKRAQQTPKYFTEIPEEPVRQWKLFPLIFRNFSASGNRIWPQKSIFNLKVTSSLGFGSSVESINHLQLKAFPMVRTGMNMLS